MDSPPLTQAYRSARPGPVFTGAYTACLLRPRRVLPAHAPGRAQVNDISDYCHAYGAGEPVLFPERPRMVNRLVLDFLQDAGGGRRHVGREVLDWNAGSAGLAA